ncbi:MULTISPECIES: hypothetical protein [Ruminococcus]|jgi:hypothetical protein|uniref:hypothetical protein n=1 Tax=Ruminococcus TaxID=1263 RepID=UPI000E4380B6|nr:MULTISPECIES: hypothetical protein [Ruminococcus]MCR5022243.1 hypothetical protein [Ruminococcus sp.]RGM82931.1 hypothetical protein DXB92_01400 [Ruminococcus sp. OM06-36AC]
MKKKNELVPANSSESNFTLNVPDGRGTFEKGIDGRGNPFEKRTYENGDFLKQELLHSGELKVTAKKKIK